MNGNGHRAAGITVSSQIIWTAGHSTRTIEEFLAVLAACQAEVVADVRSFPASSRCPWFNSGALAASLAARGIGYVHIPALGGRRGAQPDVPAGANSAWRNASFRNYADYALSGSFRAGLGRLQEMAAGQRTAFMCAEAVPWRCHRMILSDHLTAAGWDVRHVTGTGTPAGHEPGRWGPRPAACNGTVTYPPPWLQLTLAPDGDSAMPARVTIPGGDEQR